MMGIPEITAHTWQQYLLTPHLNRHMTCHTVHLRVHSTQYVNRPRDGKAGWARARQAADIERLEQYRDKLIGFSFSEVFFVVIRRRIAVLGGALQALSPRLPG
jgi:hypothetical protein